MKTIAIIVAGGQGRRMGRPKQFLKIAGHPVLSWTLAAFQKSTAIDGIILVIGRQYFSRTKRFKFPKLMAVVPAGRERPDSVNNGLNVLPDDAAFVAIHDGARPLVTPEIIGKAVAAAKKYGAAVVGVPAKDTLKVVSRKSLVVSGTLNRSNIWQAQTPQVFRQDIILKAYKKGYNKSVTDDAMLVENLGRAVRMVIGSYDNLKITTPEDLVLAEAVLKKRGK